MNNSNWLSAIVVCLSVLAVSIGSSGKLVAQSSGQGQQDFTLADVASSFGLGVRDLFTVCVGKQKICYKDGNIASAYTGDFSTVKLSGNFKVPRYGNMLFIPGNLTPEPKGVFKFLIGTKFTDGIFSHVPRMNGDILLGSKLPGKLGKAVTEKYGGRIIVDGGVQFIARAKIGGLLGEFLNFFG